MTVNGRDQDLTTQDGTQDLSARTIGRLISGFGERPTSLYREVVVSPEEMTRCCRVTFRPLPKGYRNAVVESLRQNLQQALERHGVKVVPWRQATEDYHQRMILPILNRSLHVCTRAVRNDIHAVFDVERPRSLLRRLGIAAAESLYRLTCLAASNGRVRSLSSIARLSLWADSHAAKHVQDHTRTQIITLMELDRDLVNPDLPYAKRIRLGLAALAHTFSQIVIGTCEGKVSIVNMNLTDAVVDAGDLDAFVRMRLVPKLFVPIAPMLPSQFELGRYDPQQSGPALRLAHLSGALASTGLLPDVQTLGELLQRRSRRDIVRVIAGGRTGVSFGFIANVEPPSYRGPREIPSSQWGALEPVAVYDPAEIRRDAQGTLYARVQAGAGAVYRQIPELWIVSSRSGSDKTQLCPDRDILRVGFNGSLHLQLPCDPSGQDLNPSYDIRVMMALALSAALYAPDLLAQGASLFHFHGYPHRDWFRAGEVFAGMDNPALPCGTTEAGVFNFQTMAQLARTHGRDLKLACIIEPDHGTNILAPDTDYLISRVREGAECGHLMLGGQHFDTLKASPNELHDVVATSVVISPPAR